MTNWPLAKRNPGSRVVVKLNCVSVQWRTCSTRSLPIAAILPPSLKCSANDMRPRPPKDTISGHGERSNGYGHCLCGYLRPAMRVMSAVRSAGCALPPRPRDPLPPQCERAFALQQRLGVSAEPCRDDLGLDRHRAGQPVRDQGDLHFGDRQAGEAQGQAARLRPGRLVARELPLDGKCESLRPERADGRLEEHAVEAPLRAKVLQKRYQRGRLRFSGRACCKTAAWLLETFAQQRL